MTTMEVQVGECEVPGCPKATLGRRRCSMHAQRKAHGVPDHARCAWCDKLELVGISVNANGDVFCSGACDDAFTLAWYSAFLRQHGRGPLLAEPISAERAA